MSPAMLVIAGVDSSGGAGVLRDHATARGHGVAVRVAVTAVTAQNDEGVRAVYPIPPDLVVTQIASAGSVGAIKIGMLGTAASVVAIAEALPAEVPIVLDPVLNTTSGFNLLDPAGQHALMRHLLPRVALLTPNLPELAAFGTLLGLHNADEATIVGALQRAGVPQVLVKGGHAAGARCEDRLYWQGDELVRFCSPRLPLSLRGTGCQLSTGVAAGLAQEMPMKKAVASARQVLGVRFAKALASRRGPGPGH